MRAGRLRHTIDILQSSSAQDPTTGAVTELWNVIASNVPASVEPLSVREFIEAQSTQSEITARIVIRYREGLDASMRIRHGSRLYDAAGFLPDPHSGREYLTIPVKAVGNV